MLAPQAVQSAAKRFYKTLGAVACSPIESKPRIWTIRGAFVKEKL
jgi:hypothetical protein